MANKSYEFLIEHIIQENIKLSSLEESFLKNLKLTTLEIHDLHISQVASMFYMSNASITRFSQKLGYSGFTELKYAIQNASSTYKYISQNRYFEIIDGTKELNEKIIRFINSFHTFNKILIVGLEYNGLVAKEFRDKLMNLEFENVEYATEPYKIDMLSSSLSDKDLLIILSLDGYNQNILRIAENASLNNISILSICENKDSRLKKLSNIFINTPRYSDNTYSISKTIPLLLYTDIICETIKLSRKNSQ